MKDEVKDSDKANEPEDPFFAGNKRITFFSSFVEENEATHRYYSLLTPEERLSHVNKMIKRIFADELLKYPTLGNRIFFD